MDLSDDQIRALPHSELLTYFYQMKEEYVDFQQSSLEMEKMMDSELEEVKGNLKRAENRLHMLTQENERNKSRQDESRTQWCQVEEQLRRENAELRETCERQKTQICRLEQKNDVLEASERNKEFMAGDLGKQLDRAFEKIAILESDLYEKQVAQEEMQRLRIEELRTSAERPRLVVEPLRNEALPDEPSPGPSKSTSTQDHSNDICMEVDDVEERLEQVQISGKPTGQSSVNLIVRSLISKVEHLETVLSSIKLSTSRA
ncbi:unnamed protein product [Caenorhabditis angaria]|uniref:NUDE domain-containing protein n=1 Tax=Caenorhabditis angaria TaxID=860376 RepID=A0A9P1MX06_9PELO|nr:unnamed protein product [Caenorhabditis angaria]